MQGSDLIPKWCGSHMCQGQGKDSPVTLTWLNTGSEHTPTWLEPRIKNRHTDS